MYWQYNNSNSPQFEAVLQKEGVTLQEVMDENDIIQECKMQNKKLIDFLCQRNILEELVTLITEEPSENLDERSRFKYPNIACELLTCDVPALNETLSRDNELLEKLYSFIDKEPPLNPLLASFLSRTLGVLIVKRLDQWLSYQYTCLQAMGFLKDKKNFVSLLLKHLGTSAIMDLTLKLITEVGDDEHRQNLLNWLDSQNLVQSLVDLFDAKVDGERHHNVAQLLCDVLRISRDLLNDTQDPIPDPIFTRLESPETVAQLLDRMLASEKSESSIVGGIQVLLALLGQKNNFTDSMMLYEGTDSERRQKNVAQSTATVIKNRLKDFHEILRDPPKKDPVRTTVGLLDPPLGNTRLQVTRLIVALIATNITEIHQELMDLGVVDILLELFFNYMWNNFLHEQVQQCITAVFANANLETADPTTTPVQCDSLSSYLVTKCRLLGRIVEAWDDNEEKQFGAKGIRRGYMGHLINIANLVVKQMLVNSAFDAFITENVAKDSQQTWKLFVDGPLAKANRLQNIVLGGVHPISLTNDDSNDDCNIPPYPHSLMLVDFRTQQTADCSSPFGDESALPMERHEAINLNLSDDLEQQAELFKKLCFECVNTLDDSEDNIFDENVANLDKKTIDTNWNPLSSDTENATLGDMDPWSMETNRSPSTIAEPNNPWTNTECSNNVSSEDDWADFDSFSPVANLNTTNENDDETNKAASTKLGSPEPTMECTNANAKTIAAGDEDKQPALPSDTLLVQTEAAKKTETEVPKSKESIQEQKIVAETPVSTDIVIEPSESNACKQSEQTDSSSVQQDSSTCETASDSPTEPQEEV